MYVILFFCHSCDMIRGVDILPCPDSCCWLLLPINKLLKSIDTDMIKINYNVSLTMTSVLYYIIIILL